MCSLVAVASLKVKGGIFFIKLEAVIIFALKFSFLYDNLEGFTEHLKKGFEITLNVGGLVVKMIVDWVCH